MTTTDDGSLARTGRQRVRFACVLVVIALLATAPVAAATGANANQPTETVPTEPAFVVALDAEGTGQVTLTTTFDLTTDGERRAFEALRANETGREQRAERFAARMDGIASSAENETGRSMAIRDAAISFTERNDTGIVALSVTWEGLAAQDGDRLVLSEPFDSEFALERTFRVAGPDGYALETVTPEPSDRGDNAATWDGSASFDGFEATFAPTDGDSAADGGASSSVPGFGVGIAALAVLGGTAVLTIRDQNRR
ncbi:hypothetical protein [Natrinema sp. 1APR25-10V2]|uniref:DUF7345 domain-containing protein n=1 Tax=Natrinema sp. 1APR25-10V2 TaxID=2951081 RepID=UPI0028770B1E|nr:hypothetical protein [Natrinema sp. 1APR25-10V2]MDS0474217.1 hypothetical protein [Natrinema sp. 1APR25-10V2]